MLGVGTSIWNRALAGKGDGSGGNPPAGVTPLHSLDLTTAPSASNSFDDYGLSLPRTVTDYNGRIVTIPANAVPMGGLRPVHNVARDSHDLTDWTISASASVANHASGGTELTFDISADSKIFDTGLALTIGRVYAISALVSVAAGTKGFRLRLGAAAQSSGDLTATTTPQRFSYSATNAGAFPQIMNESGGGAGSIIIDELQIQDITHRADLSTAPDEFVSTADDYGTGVNGFRYFDTELANTVASNVVTEGTGASIEGWLDYQPGDTNYVDCTHDFSGGADTITLTATGYYTLWLEGTAQVSVAAGTATMTGAGAATEGSPVTINCTATGTITLTRDSGTLDEWGAYQIIQLNDGTVPTAFIPSTGSASRPAMNPAPTISGLAGTEDARVTVQGLGDDVVTNGGFDTDSDWTKGPGWSIAGGKAIADGSQAGYSYLAQVALAVGTRHFVQFDATISAGALHVYIGGRSTGIKTTTGSFVAVTDPAVNTLIQIEANADFEGQVDNVRAFPIDPTDDTARIIDIDNTDGEFDTLPSPIKVLSIDVYNDGERP